MANEEQAKAQTGAAPSLPSGPWSKIKRHKVVEWTLAYVAAGFALVHAIDLASHAFEWPLMVSRLTMIVWLVGIPIAVAVAWYHGHRAQHRLSTGELIIVTLLLVIAGSILWSFSRRAPESTAASSIPAATVAAVPSAPAFAPPPHSVAVLPFTNLSGDPKQEYFSDGVTEELIDALSQVDSLQVTARTSSFSFKGKDVDVETIAHKLNVGAVLEGSIRRVGNTVRITAQLINAVNGFHIWSQHYDRDLTNALAMQSEIATTVVQQLQAKLLGDEAAKIEAGGTHDPTAYDANLRGRQILANAGNPQEYRKAAAAADEAIAADPQYADAYTLKARALSLHGFSYPSSIEGRNQEFSQALEAGRHAVMLAPNQGEAHAALAYAMLRKLDISGAAAEFNRAVSLSPGNADVQELYGLMQALLDHRADALTAMRRAIELDPQNSRHRAYLAVTLMSARRPSEALASLRDADALNPGSPLVGYYRWQAYLYERRFDLAAQYCETADSPLAEHIRNVCLARAYHGLGKGKEAREQLAKLEAQYGDFDAFSIAIVYAQFGETRNAIDWLLKAERLRDPYLAFIKMYLTVDPIRDEPAFKALVRRLNFPP